MEKSTPKSEPFGDSPNAVFIVVEGGDSTIRPLRPELARLRDKKKDRSEKPEKPAPPDKDKKGE